VWPCNVQDWDIEREYVVSLSRGNIIQTLVEVLFIFLSAVTEYSVFGVVSASLYVVVNKLYKSSDCTFIEEFVDVLASTAAFVGTTITFVFLDKF